MRAKLRLSKAGLKWEDTDVLLGHRMPYYKPTVEHLEEECLKAVPFLTVSEAEQAKKELAVKEEVWGRESKDLKLELLLLKAGYGERLARLEGQLRGALGVPPEATPVPRSRPRTEAWES